MKEQHQQARKPADLSIEQFTQLIEIRCALEQPEPECIDEYHPNEMKILEKHDIGIPSSTQIDESEFRRVFGAKTQLPKDFEFAVIETVNPDNMAILPLYEVNSIWVLEKSEIVAYHVALAIEKYKISPALVYDFVKSSQYPSYQPEPQD